jgi:hypothetical protein
LWGRWDGRDDNVDSLSGQNRGEPGFESGICEGALVSVDKKLHFVILSFIIASQERHSSA